MEIINITLFQISQISQLPACSVLYVILVCFWKNRQTHYGAKNWYEVLRQLDLSFIDEIIIKKYYERHPKYVKAVVLFLFFCWLFEITHTELARFLEGNKGRFWFRFIPVHDRFLRTVSEFLGTSGQNIETKDLTLCFEKIVEQIFHLVRVEQLTDEDLFSYCFYFTFRLKTVDLPENAKGGHFFAHFIYSLGISAALSLCQKDVENKEERFLPGFGYSSTQLICVILGTLGCKNVTQLARELRNAEEPFEGINPSPQVIRQFIDKLDKDKVVSFYERFIKAIRDYKKLSSVVIAIDATVIEIYGDYENADYVYDHAQGKTVKGYKLYLIFDVTNKMPIGYLLGTSENEGTKLLDLVKQAQKILGRENIQFVLFDRGYFDTKKFAQLDEDKDHFTTMGKKCKTFKEIIAIFEKDMSLYEKVDENEWRVTFCLFNFMDFTSEDKLRTARVTIRRKLVKKSKTDPKTGEKVIFTKVEHWIYMTNILDGSVEDIVKTYGKRVAIENFFEELKNTYHLKGFPKTNYNAVVVYITLLLMGHLLLWFFCSFLTTLEGKKPYCNRELSTLKKDLLEKSAQKIFIAQENIDPHILKIQRAIEKDIAFIRKFKRFIQKTKKIKIKISLINSINNAIP